MTQLTCFVNGFICMLFFVLVAIGNALLYQRNIAFDDVTADVGWSIAARSQIHCSHVCTQNISCTSFFYVDGNDKFCQFINVTLPHWTVNTTTTPGASYFVPVNAGCPPNDAIFRTVKLLDNTLFTYRVMRQYANESEALAGCIDEGAFLAQVITQAKFDFVRNLLQCPGYNEIDMYRVDGNNINATDYFDPNGWKTRSGDIIPANFWNDTFGYRSKYHCVLMYVELNWYFIRSPCSYGTYFICETN